MDFPSLFEIRESPIEGWGAFARTGISAGTRIVEYTGEKISKDESLRRCEAGNSRIFAFDDAFDLDGNVDWNPARFVNHACVPNCEAVQQHDGIWIIAVRDIAAGEELTYNYGYDLEDYRNYPCRCGSPQCVGYIIAEEFFPLIRARRDIDSPRDAIREPSAADNGRLNAAASWRSGDGSPVLPRVV
jgi:SET domain-containing protein